MNDCVPMRIIRLLDEKDDNGVARLIQETPADILSQRMVIGEGEEQWSLSLLEAVAARNRPDHLRALIAKGVSDVDSRDEKGITPLMVAGLEVCPEITRELLIAGASPDLQENEGGGTALHWSIMCMSEDFRPVVRMLLDAGIDYQIRDNVGKTARDHAIEYVSPVVPELRRCRAHDRRRGVQVLSVGI